VWPTHFAEGEVARPHLFCAASLLSVTWRFCWRWTRAGSQRWLLPRVFCPQSGQRALAGIRPGDAGSGLQAFGAARRGRPGEERPARGCGARCAMAIRTAERGSGEAQRASGIGNRGSYTGIGTGFGIGPCRRRAHPPTPHADRPDRAFQRAHRRPKHGIHPPPPTDQTHAPPSAHRGPPTLHPLPRPNVATPPPPPPRPRMSTMRTMETHRPRLRTTPSPTRLGNHQIGEMLCSAAPRRGTATEA
jgi:hypothetical protein